MIEITEALQAVLARARPLPAVSMSRDEALGRVLAEAVTADGDLPPFAKALMDGYAVRAVDLAGVGERVLRVLETVTAGESPTRGVGPGEATEIMTGAPMPAGADAVVMVERTRREGASVVVSDPSIRPGRSVLPRGREARAGETVLGPGRVLNAARLGVLAAVGRARVLAVPRPKVLVVATGDELVEPERAPGFGQVRNSNATMLRASAVGAGAVAEALPIAPDDPDRLAGTLATALRGDVVVISGGVSAGTRDLVPGALRALGVTQVFHKVRVKPGKPVWFGVGPDRDGGAAGPLVFGLPGNPVSGLVTFLLFVRPALAALAGDAGRAADSTTAARLARPFTHVGDRPTFHPAMVVDGDSADGLPAVAPLDWAGSADLRSAAAADGFAGFAAGDREYRGGEIVRFLRLG